MLGKIVELHRLLRNRHLSADHLRALQEEKLRAVIRHAYEYVPYYRSLFRSAGLSPEDIRTAQDLRKIPVTTKDDLRTAGLQNIVARGTDLSLCSSARTSGTTGKPFRAYFSHSEATTRHLLQFRAVYSVGFRVRDRLVILGPERAPPSRLRYRLGIFRTTGIDPYLPADVRVRRLREMQPTVLWAYPTHLQALLHAVDYRLRKVVRPRILITSAEVLAPGLRRAVHDDLGVEMFNLYGTNEIGRLAVECTAHEGLHVNADHVILECVDGDQPVAPGELGEVVVTSLNCSVMPFIRYHLGDRCTLLATRCSCGCSFPLINPPLGRNWDMIRLPSGRLLSPSFSMRVLRQYDWIDRFLFIQEDLDHFRLQLALRSSPGEQVLSEIRTQYVQFLRDPVRLDIEIVPSIRENMTKVGSFVSRLAGSNAL